MKEYQHTDVLLVNNFPFVTLTESKMANVWYHDKCNDLFMLTSRGFKLIEKGTKTALAKNGFLRTIN